MRGRIAFLALFAGMTGFLVLVAALRSRHAPAAGKSSVSQEQFVRKSDQVAREVEMPRCPEPVDSKKQGEALHDATLKSLIENARMAELRGDKVTRDAMLTGLKKSPDRSRELINTEISMSNDPAAAAALKILMEQLQ